jgi:predicted acyl esterase
MFAFLDGYLKNQTEPPPKRVIRYYTLGERSWHTTTTWPPPGLTTQRWFFGANGSLARTQPSDADGADRYAVDFAATSGPLNRWHTQAGSDVVYPNRAAADKKLLTYTSAPLARALEITGHPIVSLEVTSTASDGAFIVYLEDVAPNGRVTYITEGELRGLDRRTSTAQPPFPAFGPCPFTYLPHLTAAVQAWVGWMDAGTVDGTLARYVGGTGPQTVVIGPWSHGAASDGHQADPFDRQTPRCAGQPAPGNSRRCSPSSTAT